MPNLVRVSSFGCYPVSHGLSGKVERRPQLDRDNRLLPVTCGEFGMVDEFQTPDSGKGLDPGFCPARVIPIAERHLHGDHGLVVENLFWREPQSNAELHQALIMSFVNRGIA